MRRNRKMRTCICCSKQKDVKFIEHRRVRLFGKKIDVFGALCKKCAAKIRASSLAFGNLYNEIRIVLYYDFKVKLKEAA